MAHDAVMRVPRPVRWVLWALWVGCLVFSLWFFREVYVALRAAESS